MGTPDVEKKQEQDYTLLDRMGDLLADGGVVVAKTGGVVVGYSGRILHSIKEKSSNISMPGVSGTWAKGIFTGGVMKRWGGERSTININIAKSKEKIEKLYYEIGKRGASLSGVEDITDHESVKELVDEVKALEERISKWEDRLKEIEKERKAAREKKKIYTRINIKGDASDEQVKNRVKEITEKAMRIATFENASEKVIFDKVTHDLLDDDIEIRILAASELGKIANPAAVPVLSAAIKYNNVYLSSEIINALITIGDPSALPVFKDNITHENYRMRLGCLRGLYKLDGKSAVPFLVDALKDEHKEVRKSSATFLGWLGINDAVPALIQTIKDPDQDVKKAAVMALSGLRDPSSVMPLIRALGESDMEVREKIVHAMERITGRAVDFKIAAEGNKLKQNIAALKEWWQKNRTGDVEETLDAGAAEETTAPIDTTAEESGAPEEEQEDEGETDTDTDTDTGTDTGTEPEAEAESEEEKPLTEAQLQGMLKKDLIQKCDELGIDNTPEDTKATLTQKILEKCGN